ncbi:hypothetical protein [Microbacterium sp. BF1]|nr:hypothetical protein [Microbacterium sp. BF1]
MTTHFYTASSLDGFIALGLDILARSRLCLVSDTGTEVIADTVLQLSA